MIWDEPELHPFQRGDRVTWFPQIGTVLFRAAGGCYVLWDGYDVSEWVPNHHLTAV